MPAVTQMEECAYCGKRGDTLTIRLCTGCKAIRYCSRGCQKGDWSRHKAACKKSKRSEYIGYDVFTDVNSEHVWPSGKALGW